MEKRRTWNLLVGAVFLMATTAVGPGFLTQTAVFTEQLAASFGFVILMSIILDIGSQLNVWRIIAVSKMRAQDIANKVLPGLGIFIAFLIVLGGFAFNIGNIAGAGLGTNVLFGITPEMGAIYTAIIAVFIFLVREAGKVMDRFVLVMGVILIVLTMYVVLTSAPPVGEAVVKTFVPDQMDFMAIVTIVGGTVGGFIMFSGGHRFLDAGVMGKEVVGEVSKGAIYAIGIASLIRILLFLAALGVIAQGMALDPANPPASVFQLAAGEVGYKIFGVVMWAASITSVIGCAYTSISFIRSFHPFIEKNNEWFIIAFIVICTTIFVSIGRPVTLLILAGALNGLILPITLGVMLIAAYRPRIVGDYKHPWWMTFIGGVVVISMTYLGVYTLINEIPKLL